MPYVCAYCCAEVKEGQGDICRECGMCSGCGARRTPDNCPQCKIEALVYQHWGNIRMVQYWERRERKALQRSAKRGARRAVETEIVTRTAERVSRELAEQSKHESTGWHGGGGPRSGFRQVKRESP